jgi:hypothetical protein
MIGNIIIFAVADSFVTAYIYIVNRFLRSDEYWTGNGALDTTASPEPKAKAVVPVTSHSVLAVN